MDPMPIPVLDGERIRLRPHTLDDLDPVIERCVDPESIRWTTVPTPYTRDMGEEYLASIMQPSDQQVVGAIEADGRYAGTIDLRAWICEPGQGAGNLGFVTHPWARGRGVMSDAVALGTAHVFDSLCWELLVWQANVGNVASYKAVWRNGFPLPTLVPALLNHKGRMRDAWHSVLEHEAPREPVGSWEEAYAVLQGQVRASRRPG